MSLEPVPNPYQQKPTRLSRRTLLGLLGGAGIAGIAGSGGFSRVGGSLANSIAGSGAGPTAQERGAVARHSSSVAGRVLVMLELQGGNDGLATIPPIGDGLYHDIRGDYSFGEASPKLLDDGIHAWNPNLEQLAPYGLAGLLGVGVQNHSGSHFEMEKRWWAGDDDGSAHYRSGFLGRLCDQLDEGSLVTGVSIGDVQSRALISERAVTLTLPDPWRAWFLEENEGWFRNLRLALAEMGHDAPTDEGELWTASRAGLNDALAYGQLLSGLDTEEKPYPASDLGGRLAIAAELVERDAGVRVIHVPYGGFDTHSGQQYEHDYLMMEMGEAVAAFLADMADIGRAQDVLVATTSEFGRRAPMNEGGTDHGSASVALLAGGSVNTGLHGDRSLLSDLDEEDNLRPNISMTEYYATLAECWFGVPASEVLPQTVTPLDGLLAV